MIDMAIFGAGVGAEVLAAYILEDNRYRLRCFVADTLNEDKTPTLMGINVYSFDTYRAECSGLPMLNSVGYTNQLKGRHSVLSRLENLGIEVISYIHPTSFISKHAIVENGSIILANSVIEPFAKVKKNTFIWCNCTVAHHSELGRSNWVASGVTVSGHVVIGDQNLIGVNSTISNSISIGNENIICGAALVSKNIGDNTFWIDERGAPANISAEQYSRFLK